LADKAANHISTTAQSILFMVCEIISYYEMCRREGTSLQRGMYFKLGGGHSVVLMSRNGPYPDDITDGGQTIIYVGHNVRKHPDTPDPKSVDQPRTTRAGKLTQNGKFEKAAQNFKNGGDAEKVRVYEKLDKKWLAMGMFDLTDSWTESDGRRDVFKFKLEKTR